MALHFVDETAGSAQPGDALTLTGAEAHHAASVRRVRVGEAVSVTDGRGAWLEGACESVAPREVVVRITARRDEEAPLPRIALAQALAKGDRDEMAVQAATELGVDEIVPWQASRSVSRWEGPKAEKGRARWATIVREAAKQAHRAWLPEVTPIATTAALAARPDRILVLEPTADERLSVTDVADAESILLIVGPEGGIAPDEQQRLRDAGARLVRLGDTVLRTSTAGPAALALLNARLGRW
ncbi:16S rRNA (uracil(1498)-N(3))-methyltransferase [Microbacterium sp. JZ31]|uniref:16S rRNA (uracil(1498)-N(3))-methyltransferase n=1 Tax=Microbacterium sp. JZ31 TaxID=1906274 RepID=UPI0019337EC8|nr:16S rRNA (uracil(1498)-N(3))-methyltransferase [Microbacterium sp. JZ31]